MYNTSGLDYPVFFLLKAGCIIESLYESNFSILAMQSFILFKTIGIAEQLLEIFSFSNFSFLAVSGSSGADELSSLEMFCSDAPVQYKPDQRVKYSDKKKRRKHIAP